VISSSDIHLAGRIKSLIELEKGRISRIASTNVRAPHLFRLLSSAPIVARIVGGVRALIVRICTGDHLWVGGCNQELASLCLVV
jgi:hypothetical protein